MSHVTKKLEEIKIEITNSCNKNCYFCFSKINKQNQVKLDLNFNIIKNILDQAKDIGVLGVRFTGGEPLLKKDLKNILIEAKKKGLYVILNTNGELINNNINLFDFIDEVLLSVHFINEFDLKKKVIDLLNKKKLEKEQNGSNLIIKCCSIMTKENIDQLEQFYKFFNENKVDNWFLLRLVTTNNKTELNKTQTKRLINKIIKLNQKSRTQTFIANAVPFCIFDKDKMINVCIGGRNDNGNTRLVVDAKGNIKSDYFSETILGNVINGDKIIDCWNSEKLKNYNSTNILDKCKTCSYFNKCRAGILLNRDNNKNIRYDPLMEDY